LPDSWTQPQSTERERVTEIFHEQSRNYIAQLNAKHKASYFLPSSEVNPTVWEPQCDTVRKSNPKRPLANINSKTPDRTTISRRKSTPFLSPHRLTRDVAATSMSTTHHQKIDFKASKIKTVLRKCERKKPAKKMEN
jgi:hypothetical protein